ncbi:hypothetical protein FWH09_00315 [Candidatus Saccharibacteria bacterium]|nr:hypothetical protein [Candidatus Saccharibacteria bacterium]
MQGELEERPSLEEQLAKAPVPLEPLGTAGNEGMAQPSSVVPQQVEQAAVQQSAGQLGQGQAMMQPQQQQAQPTGKNTVEKPKKKKKWIGKIILILLLGGILFLVTKIWVIPYFEQRAFERDQAQHERFMMPTAFDLIKEDFQDGKISADEYVRQLTFATFSVGELDARYVNDSLAPEPTLDIIEIAEEFEGRLSDETIELLADIYFPQISFEDGDGGTAGVLDKTWLTQNVSAAENTIVKNLNKVVLSESRKFIVFYTDAGDDRISDSVAQRTADQLDKNMESMRTQFGLEFGWRGNYIGEGDSYRHQRRLVARTLGVSESEAENIIDNAMPIYIMNPRGENGSGMAYHTSISDLGWFMQQLKKVFSRSPGRVPIYPHIVIRPQFMDETMLLDFIVAHELAHNYQLNYCRDNGISSGPGCPSDLFTSETWANYVAAEITEVTLPRRFLGIFGGDMEEGGFFSNRWATSYTVRSKEYLADARFRGYANFAWAKAYVDNVPNGKDYFLQALRFSTHDEALSFMYDKAGSNWRNVMLDLAEKNVTNEWGNDAYNSFYLPPPRGELCTDSCIVNGSAPKTAIHYYYLNISDFNTNYEFKVSISALSSMGVVLIGGKGENYTTITRGFGDLEFDPHDYSDYDELIIGLANTGFDAGEGPFFPYWIRVENEDLTELIGEAELGGEFLWMDGNCITIDVRGTADMARQLFMISQGVDVRDGSEFGDALQNIVDGIGELFGDVAEGFSIASRDVRRVRVCVLPIASDVSNDELHRRLPSMLGIRGIRMTLFDSAMDGVQIQVVGGITLNGFGQYYSLITEPSGERVLFSMDVEYTEHLMRQVVRRRF